MQDPSKPPAVIIIDDAWATKLGELLVEAAELSVEHDLDLDAFMQGAWRAYLEARPGLKEHLEDMQLRSQLQAAREAGQVAQA